MTSKMTSTRPYLIRAFYEWIVNNNCTPYIVVNAGADYVEVPMEYVEKGQIVLNISLMAVQGLILGEEAIEFQARFGGRARKIYAPCHSIMAIYANENGRGMVFAEEENFEEQNLSESPIKNPSKLNPAKSPFLTEISSIKQSSKQEQKEGDPDSTGDGSGGSGKGKKSGDRSHLRVIK